MAIEFGAIFSRVLTASNAIVLSLSARAISACSSKADLSFGFIASARFKLVFAEALSPKAFSSAAREDQIEAVGLALEVNN